MTVWLWFGLKNAAQPKDFAFLGDETAFFTILLALQIASFLKGFPQNTRFLRETKNRTKMMFEITVQKVFRDRCGPEALQGAGSVAGLGAPAPLEII